MSNSGEHLHFGISFRLPKAPSDDANMADYQEMKRLLQRFFLDLSVNPDLMEYFIESRGYSDGPVELPLILEEQVLEQPREYPILACLLRERGPRD